MVRALLVIVLALWILGLGASAYLLHARPSARDCGRFTLPGAWDYAAYQRCQEGR